MKIIFFFLLSAFSQMVLADLQVEQAWVKNAPPVVPMRAAYLSFVNKQATDIKIDKIESPFFEKIEMHETRYNNGVYSMQQLTTLTIPANGRVNFKPKGKHLMMINPSQSLQGLSQIEITIHYDKQHNITLNMPIKDSL